MSNKPDPEFEAGRAAGKRLSLPVTGAPPKWQEGFLAGRHEAFRSAGMDVVAMMYPRTLVGIALLCAFNGTKPDAAPPAWSYHPNETTRESWERVVASICAMNRDTPPSWEACYLAWAPMHGRVENAPESTRKAWQRVADAGATILW